MLINYLSFLKIIEIFASVFNWVEIHSFSYEIDKLSDSVKIVEFQLNQVDYLVETLEDQFDINLYSFCTEKNRSKLETLFNQ